MHRVYHRPRIERSLKYWNGFRSEARFAVFNPFLPVRFVRFRVPVAPVANLTVVFEQSGHRCSTPFPKIHATTVRVPLFLTPLSCLSLFLSLPILLLLPLPLSFSPFPSSYSLIDSVAYFSWSPCLSPNETYVLVRYNARYGIHKPARPLVVLHFSNQSVRGTAETATNIYAIENIVDKAVFTSRIFRPWQRGPQGGFICWRNKLP